MVYLRAKWSQKYIHKCPALCVCHLCQTPLKTDVAPGTEEMLLKVSFFSFSLPVSLDAGNIAPITQTIDFQLCDLCFFKKFVPSGISKLILSARNNPNARTIKPISKGIEAFKPNFWKPLLPRPRGMRFGAIFPRRWFVDSPIRSFIIYSSIHS